MKKVGRQNWKESRIRLRTTLFDTVKYLLKVSSCGQLQSLVRQDYFSSYLLARGIDLRNFSIGY